MDTSASAQGARERENGHEQAGISQRLARRRRYGWRCDAWRLTLKKGRAVEHFNYYTGLGHRQGGEPSLPPLEGVFYCLVSDAEAATMCFEDWCNCFGYDSDSRKAHKMYKACADAGLRLSRILGYTAIEEIRELLRDY